MNCDIFNTVFLRANGRFSCGCDTGHEINLASASADEDWTPARLFGSRGYSLARAMFRRGYVPWGETCERCVMWQRAAPFAHDRPTKRLRQFLFEPSFACALRCPCCPRAELAPTRPGTVFLPLNVWRRVLRSFAEHGYAIDQFLTTGLGDPLTHPEFERLLEAIREFFPQVPITVNTHGNYRFARIFPRGIYPDRLLVSVDGLHQASYEQYRINGRVDSALQFMAEARRIPAERVAVEWKYILFDHNDADAQLIAAQRKASELDVDSLQFVFTHTRGRSVRYTPRNVHELPIVWSGAYPDATCHMHLRRWEPVPLPRRDAAPPDQSRPRIQVDSCHQWSELLHLRGWAMGRDGSAPRRLVLQPASGPATEARTRLVREDVWRAYPHTHNRTSGFDATLALPRDLPGSSVAIDVRFETDRGEVFSQPVSYDLRRCQPALMHAPSAR